MSANATGTPTTNFSIPKFNTASDAPNGKGTNEMMDALDTLLATSFSTAYIPKTLTTTTGDLIYASAPNTPSRLALAAAGNSLTSVGGLPQWKQRATGFFTPANPTGTTSASLVHMGFAGTVVPAVSGIVFFLITGEYANNSTGNGNMRLQFGTGAAPINGAAITGTSSGANPSFGSLGAGVGCGYTVLGFASGLVLGTTYWFDLVLSNAGAGTSSVIGNTLVAIELG